MCDEFFVTDVMLMKFFDNFDFKVLYLLKKCPIFVGYVHNFGKSDYVII